jgi:beta-lactamase regulating signal transducer with metallopeptidase domain
MTGLFTYLLELNITVIILYVAYKIFFEKDRNFSIRRIYLLGVALLPFLMPLIPDAARVSFSDVNPVTISLDEITVFGQGSAKASQGFVSFWDVLALIYLAVLGLGLIKLILQLVRIFRAIQRSDRLEAKGAILLSHPTMHASSFFGYIFIDPASVHDDSFQHILDHENIHKREWHSVDRILVELFVMVNWFNPVAWLFRRSVIENLEYLADSAVVRRMTDPSKYQLSILNQYIGSASITNQFSSQIKNRINMLNKNYKLGSTWKLAMFIPLAAVVFFFVSCTERDMTDEASAKKSAEAENVIYQQVEEMPSFQNNEPAEFRKFIAKSLMYPKEAKENGVSGKIIIKFVVQKDGKVVIPDISELPPTKDGTEMGEVVVVAYRPLVKDAPAPDDKYIQLLKNEAIRVVKMSPPWEPGKIDGKPVNVMFTFPIVFALQ